MPANLTPEYFKAERWFRTATTNEEKILALEQMLRVMPKHKGTDGLKADLRRKLSKFREVATQKKRGGGVDAFHVPRTGAGQVALLGLPNCGKSSIVAALTNAKVHVAEFPFATGVPVPGMMNYEDVQIQIVDTPPITAEYSAPGQVGTYRNCDLIAIVIDLSGDVREQMRVCVEFLEVRNLLSDEQTPAYDQQGNVLGKKVFVICNKLDAAQDGALERVRKSTSRMFEYVPISVATGEGLGQLGAKIFELLGIIRVYAKPPGKPPDMDEPFTMPLGSTVMEMASQIHRELAEKLRAARVWGTGVYSGQNVHLTHVLHDKDVVELHFG
jgi:hypothetical protein